MFLPLFNERSQVEDFVAALRLLEVEMLIDIRSNFNSEIDVFEPKAI